ncbi:MAG: imidazole glycerol phosphate synthase subunit HisH [Bacteroidales bacterium]|nr:imidazole glycerol phosphate synthase subunit HisH [Bacteroidales bacterium]
MKVVIIKYNAGNIMSVEFALRRMGIQPVLSNKPEDIYSADRVIFPGVGEASTTMKYLKKHKLDLLIKDLKQPVLGICLGMQLMCAWSEENNTKCIGIFNDLVKKFEPVRPENNETGNWIKVPQMGWNNLHEVRSKLFDNSIENQYVYFVHSYYVPLSENTIAKTDYILKYSAALQKNNFYATQFHPEKSGIVGEKILKNFIEKC